MGNSCQCIANACAPSFKSRGAFMATRNERMALYSWLHQFFYSSIDLIRITMNSDTLIVSIESASIFQRVI